MDLERGFRRLVVVLSVAVLGFGVAMGLLAGSWLQFLGIAGGLVALLWAGFYAARWVARGFASGRPAGPFGPTWGNTFRKIPRKRLWSLAGIALVLALLSVSIFLGVPPEVIGEEAGRVASAALLAWGITYLVIYLCRRKSLPKERWRLRLQRLRGDRLFTRVLIFAFLVLLAGANLARYEWKPYTSAVGGFEVTGPGRPKEEITTVDTSSGPAEEHCVSFNPGGPFTFGVCYLDLPPSRLAEGADSILTDMVVGLGSSPGRTFFDEKEVSLEGYMGREFAFRNEKGQATRARVYVIRERMYMLVVNGAPGRDFSDEAPRFLNSFKLLTK